MVEDLKNYESGQENENPMATLSDEKSFEEHMEDLEKDTSIGEKYYQQAEAQKNEWVESFRDSLAAKEKMELKDAKRLVNPGHWKNENEKPVYRPLDENNDNDVEEFNRYKADQIQNAKDNVEKNERINLNRLARAFYNQERIDQITEKLENNEEFTEEEVEFLGDPPTSVDDLFPFWKFETPEVVWDMYNSLTDIPRYEGLLDPGDKYMDAKRHPEWSTVAKAQIREMIKEGKSLLHNSEEVQNALENMEERRAANPFTGETNINSVTGEARTFDLEENYPRQDGESDEEYANRLKRIKLKTRQAEMRHE